MIHATSFLDVVLAVRGIEGVQKLGSNIQQIKTQIRELHRKRIDIKAEINKEFVQKTVKLKREISAIDKEIAKIERRKIGNQAQLDQAVSGIKQYRDALTQAGKEKEKLYSMKEQLSGNQNLKNAIKELKSYSGLKFQPQNMGPIGKKWLKETYDPSRPDMGTRQNVYDSLRGQLAQSGLTQSERGKVASKLYGTQDDSMQRQFQKYIDDKFGKVRSETRQMGEEKVNVNERINAIKREEAALQELIQKQETAIASLKELAKTYSSDLGVLKDKKKGEQGNLKDSGIKKTAETLNRAEGIREEIRAAEILKEKYEQAKADADDMSRSWASIAYFATKMQQSIAEGLRELKNLQIANVFSRGVTSGLNPYSNPVMGADVSEYGEVAKQLARTPYSKQFSSNINPLISYSKIFGEDPNQVIPIASGMQTMLGDKYSTERILNTMFATSTQSGFGFSGWSSIMMQNTLPQLQTLGVELKTIASLMGGLSNLGMGPFAAFGMNSISTLMAGGGSDEQKKIMTALMGQPDAFAKVIKQEGMYAGLEKLGAALDKYDSGKQLQIMTKLFGGMGTGVGGALIKNVDMFKDLEYKMSSLTFGKAQQTALRQTPAIMMEEYQAAAKNMNTSLVDAGTNLDSFKGQLKGVTTLFISLANGMQSFKKWTETSKVGKVVGEGLGAATQVTTAYFIGKALGAQLPGIYKQLVNAVGGKPNDKTQQMYGNIGKSLGFLGALFSVTTMIYGSMQNYFDKVTQRKQEDVTLLEIALNKIYGKDGAKLTKDELRALMDFWGMNPKSREERDKANKMIEEMRPQSVNIKVDVSGTDPINQDSARTIGKEAGKAFQAQSLSRQVFQQVEAY